MGMVETLEPSAPLEDLALRLELRPMLEEWPGRLLRDPWWSTAEAPLPDMKPLSLDEVWVDLQVLDPEEGPALAGRETLRALLDQRFEERRWRAEPLEWILERLSGITAFIGPPGSGKTTLLKWIARRLVMRPGESRFLLPLFVPLRSYVLRKREGQEDSLLRCALRECGVRNPDQQRLWLHVLNEISGLWRNRALVLLDGWDEVPVEERASLLDEVRDLAYGFSVLVTSRPAAFSSRLAASRVYEVADLPPDTGDTLIRRWFRGVGAPEQADALVRHLDLHPDLRRLVRNPFLLTLLCGISYLTRRRAGLDLPTSRAALYRETLCLVYAHHNERYPHLPIGEREEQIERLALWLLDEAPGAPRFVFGPSDVTASGADADLLPRYLQPSRLLGRLAPEEDSHHFLHATFQEYLAARALERAPERRALRSLRAHVTDASWQEVFHFLAANAGPLRDAFWREMSRQAARPDRFGIVAARLARWVAAAGARDGGAALLGRDLRDLLWPLIERLARNRLWIEAYAELDAPGFVARATQASQAADPRRKANLQRALGRVRSPVASHALVDQILGKDPQAAAVAASQLQLRIDEDGLRRLRAAAASPEVSPAIRRQAIQALGYGRDGIALPSLLQLVQREPALADEAVRAIGRIGGSEATAALARLLGEETGSLGAVVVRALGEMREASARDALLDELARRGAGDPLLLPLLDALSELPIHRGSELIMEWLGGPPDLRRAAIWALAEATGPGVYDGLIAAARNDPEEEVRLAALEILEPRLQPTESDWLPQLIGDEARSLDERVYALRALLGRMEGWSANPDVGAQARRLIEVVLSDPEGELALEAVLYAHKAGPGVAPRLIEICLDPRASPSVRESACAALGKLETAGAREALLSLVRAAPDADDDEDQVLEAGADRVARAAAEALTRIDVTSLLREPGATAEHALARFSIETGALVFDSHVLGPDGREWARAPVRARETSARSASRRSRMRSDPPLAADLEIEVSPHTVNGELILRYSITSGVVHLSVRKAQTQPLGSLAAYRDQVVRRVEKYQRGSHAADGLLVDEEIEQELRTLGQELYQQLFPPEMRLLYPQWRDKVRTIQITSGEGWIPWELVRPYDHEIQPVIDDDFLGARYQITRWVPSGRPPAPQFRIHRAACIEGGEEGTPLSAAEREKRFLEDLVRSLGAEVVSPRQATFGEVVKVIQEEETDLLHFVGHGEYSAEDPRDSKIFLVDGTSLWAGRLQGATLRKVWERRPLVFFNACSTGQQGWALVGPSGWVQAWVGIGGAGAFIAPQWQVQDELAFELARVFYLALSRGRTLGRAARLARWWARRQDPLDSTWLAFAVYGHPNARVVFGDGTGADVLRMTLQDPPQGVVPRLRPRPAPPKPAPTNAPAAPEIFIGRTADLDRLKERLGLGSDRERAPEVQVLTAIRGWPGVGKTSVASALAHDPEIASRYEGVLWAYFGPQPNLLQTLAGWGRWLGKDDLHQAGTMKDALQSLQKYLRKHRMILVLDDVWEVAHAAQLLGSRGPDCPLLITTRDTGVADLLATSPEAVHLVDVLDEESALDLLKRLAPAVVDQRPEECLRLVNELGRLPLALIVAGRLLHAENSLGLGVGDLLWELESGTAILRSEAPPDRVDLDTLTLPTVDVLFQRSTDRLDPETRERFRDLGGFEAKPATFGIDLLRLVWGVDDPRPTIRKLRDRGLLEPAGEGRFQVHSLLLRHAAMMPKVT
ncbi:MAG TPA: NB-ARC domain-containing protein [Thermoanaerobaculia bacterium]